MSLGHEREHGPRTPAHLGREAGRPALPGARSPAVASRGPTPVPPATQAAQAAGLGNLTLGSQPPALGAPFIIFLAPMAPEHEKILSGKFYEVFMLHL